MVGGAVGAVVGGVTGGITGGAIDGSLSTMVCPGFGPLGARRAAWPPGAWEGPPRGSRPRGGSLTGSWDSRTGAEKRSFRVCIKFDKIMR